jgi:hypothetical protein
MTTTMNGSARKNLSSQLDRLDQILDGLADGLNEAVKQAVTVAVQEAVRGILTEVFSNTDLLKKLRGHVSTPTPEPKTSFAKKLAGKVTGWLSAGGQVIRRLCGAVKSRIVSATTCVTDALSTAQRQLRFVRQYRVPLLTAAAVGAAAGVAAYWGGPSIAGLAGWIAGFTTTLATHAGIWLRRTLSALPPAADACPGATL